MVNRIIQFEGCEVNGIYHLRLTLIKRWNIRLYQKSSQGKLWLMLHELETISQHPVIEKEAPPSCCQVQSLIIYSSFCLSSLETHSKRSS